MSSSRDSLSQFNFECLVSNLVTYMRDIPEKERETVLQNLLERYVARINTDPPDDNYGVQPARIDLSAENPKADGVCEHCDQETLVHVPCDGQPVFCYRCGPICGKCGGSYHEMLVDYCEVYGQNSSPPCTCHEEI